LRRGRAWAWWQITEGKEGGIRDIDPHAPEKGGRDNGHGGKAELETWNSCSREGAFVTDVPA